ncbi:MAG: glycosyltransferase family 4 protein [Thermodesulfobacteriota bacterium]
MKFNVLHTEWSGGWGGQEIRVLLDIQVLTSLGHAAAVLSGPDSQITARAREAGVRVIEQPLRHAFDLIALGRLVSLLRREKFDVVNTHSSVDSWLASAAAKIVGGPVLIRTRHLSVPLRTHPLNFVYRWPDGLVTTAETIRRRLIEVNGLDGRRVKTIPTGVDLARFDPGLDPGSIRTELGLNPDHRIVTMVAVLRSWKRHEVFLEAAAELASARPELRFLVVGEGPRRPNIEDKIKSLSLEDKVLLTGHRSDVPRLLALSDVCVLTSESSEGVPQAILQYQAMNKPVVACRAGGIPEVVEHERTGLLGPVNDPKAVAGAVARLLDDPALARRLAHSGRRQVEERFSLKAMAESTLDFYEMLYWKKKGRNRND